MDGASFPRIYLNVLLPLCKPVLATVAVISFIGHWEQFLRPLIYLNSVEKFTLAVGMRYFQGDAETLSSEPLEQLLMAAAMLMTAPCILLFFVAQRYFVRGVVMSGIKG